MTESKAPISEAHRRLLAASAFAGIFVVGIVLAMLGSVLPIVSRQIGFDLSYAGNLFLSMNFAMLVAMFLVGPAMDRFGGKLPLALGSLLVAIAMVMLARAENFGLLVASVTVLGAGGGILNGGTNLLISDLHQDPCKKNSALNMLGVYFGVGALLLPLTVGSLLHVLGLGGILYIAAGLSVAVGLLYAALRFPAPKHAGGISLSEAGRLARNPLILIFGFLLFFESGNEFIMGGFTSSYLVREHGLPEHRASQALTFYWVCLMTGRFLSSRLALRMRGSTVVMLSSSAACLGILITAAAPSLPLAIAGMGLSGLGLAGVFPTALGNAGTHFEENSGTAFGLLFGIALTGGMLMPWLTGQVGQAWGLRIAFLLSAASAVAVVLLQAAALRRAKSAPQRATRRTCGAK